MTFERAVRLTATVILLGVVVSAFVETWTPTRFAQMAAVGIVALCLYDFADKRKEGDE